MSCKYYYERYKQCTYNFFNSDEDEILGKMAKCEGKKKKCKTGRWEENK